ncbi:hypothetical protein TNCV_102151 [Trichonephila clavipes]|nr:hypothetical protein TNCV_102151 [Trichonephila clavipes]
MPPVRFWAASRIWHQPDFGPTKILSQSQFGSVRYATGERDTEKRYFWQNENRNEKNYVRHPNLASAMRSIQYEDLPVPHPPTDLSIKAVLENEEDIDAEDNKLFLKQVQPPVNPII